MEQQTMDSEFTLTPASPEMQWGADAPKGARAVFSRIIKEGANAPLFLGQTMINALRDLGYNHTTSQRASRWTTHSSGGAKTVRLYFQEKGKKKGDQEDRRSFQAVSSPLFAWKRFGEKLQNGQNVTYGQCPDQV